MAEEQKTGVWLRDGNLVYMLEPTGEYRKGVELLQNLFSINVVAAPDGPREQAELLAEQLMQDLNAKSRPLTGAELQAKAQAARLAFCEWHEATFPVGSKVRFKLPSRTKPEEGEVASQAFDSQGEPYLYVHVKGGSVRLYAIQDSVTVIPAAEVE